MSVTYRRISVAQIEQDVAKTFKPVMTQIAGLINLAADENGSFENLSTENRNELVDQVGDLVQALFIRNNRAFDRDGVTALAPYPYLLNRWYVRVVRDAVKPHTDYMRRRLPDDIYTWLQRATMPTNIKVGETAKPLNFRVSEQVSAMMQPGFLPNVLAQYDTMHLWVDPNGYVLDRRIWRNSVESRDRMERLLVDMIRDGRGSVVISKTMEQFLLPGREELRTTKPYGRDVSYYAMRLGRTEIASAANRAAMLALRLNPFVETVDIARSPRGDPTCKVCPQHATIGIDQTRVREAYPVGSAPTPVFHPHCMCRVQGNVVKPATVIDELRAHMEDGEEPPITPVILDSLLLLILGTVLYNLLQSESE